MRCKLLVLLLSVALVLQGCGVRKTESTAATETVAVTADTSADGAEITKTGEFDSLSDEGLPEYMEDAVYSQRVDDLSDDYLVNNVQAIYVSQEYLDELSYNSQSNIFFGYTFAELEEQFEGQKYVYALDEDGKTTVHAFENYDDTYDEALKNVAIGTGVILVCVTVSVATAGTAPAASFIFACAAETGTKVALSSAAISAVTSGVMTAINTDGDVEAALKAAVRDGSESFKMGAICGVLSGGVSAASSIALFAGEELNGLTAVEAAQIQKESGYPPEVIKRLNSWDEYEAYKAAGLEAKMVGDQLSLVQEIDLDYVDEDGLTNLQRMQNGLAPLDENGKAYELHHIAQDADGALAILTQEQHRGEGAYKVLHKILEDSSVDHGSSWAKTRKTFWMDYAASLS
jgi:hypothetical protein